MKGLLHAVTLLSGARIAFTVHFVGDRWVVTITESLNNEQLTIAVLLGGSMGPDGKVMILGMELLEKLETV